MSPTNNDHSSFAVRFRISVSELASAVQEVRRELALRANVYPSFVKRGRLSAGGAQLHFERLLLAHDVLADFLYVQDPKHPLLTAERDKPVVRELSLDQSRG